MTTASELLDELDSDASLTPQRLKRLREDIRRYTGLTVPRGIAGVMPWYRDNREELLEALGEAAEAHTCETCGESFDSAAALAGHQNAHPDNEG